MFNIRFFMGNEHDEDSLVMVASVNSSHLPTVGDKVSFSADLTNKCKTDCTVVWRRYVYDANPNPKTQVVEVYIRPIAKAIWEDQMLGRPKF